MVGGGIREFVNDMDGPAFLERELVGLVWMGNGRSEFTTVQVEWCPFYTFREHLTCFSNVKSFTFFTLELVHQVRRYAVCKGVMG